MDALPLPPRPHLENYRKRAKELVKACNSERPAAVGAWAAEWLERLAGGRGEPPTPFVQASIERAVAAIEHVVRVAASDPGRTPLRLADAQLLIARAHGFASWPKFTRHVREMRQRDGSVGDFEAAADAIVAGNREALDALLRRSPTLIRARSTRHHSATLLHYVAANGVEDFRQKSANNAPEIASRLLELGAEVDALAFTYGGGREQTTLNLLVSSAHPARAGVQPELVETLLDFGAAIEGLDDDGSPLWTALAFGHREAAEALARRRARLDTLPKAAALGRVDLVRAFLRADGAIAQDALRDAPAWLRLAHDSAAHCALALVWAARFGRTEVLELLLDRGVDPASADRDRQTALHMAAAHGHLHCVHLLVTRGAPLESKNRWGGTVLGSTLYFARQDPIPGVDYEAVVDALVSAGANIVAAGFPTGDPRIDRALRHAGE